jgi:nucleoside-diphosphate-sugar epimerase
LKKDVCTFKTDEEIDYIIHMASIASPPLYQEHPIETLDINVLGTKKMLELAKKKNIIDDEIINALKNLSVKIHRKKHMKK